MQHDSVSVQVQATAAAVYIGHRVFKPYRPAAYAEVQSAFANMCQPQDYGARTPGDTAALRLLRMKQTVKTEAKRAYGCVY